MARLCLFCDNNAGSREHLWPKWIIARGHYGPLRHQIRKNEAIIIRPELTIRTVCQPCNNGWMSKLESDCIPVIGSMLQGLSVPLSQEQQELISVWAMKTAMMMDSIKGRDAEKRFYTHNECEQLRLQRATPNETRIWLGHYISEGLGGFGTDFTVVAAELGMQPVARGIATTIVVGHLALQVVTVHSFPEHLGRNISDVQSKAADWQSQLIQILPLSRYTSWPPKVPFDNKGRLGIGRLVERWRVGPHVDDLDKPNQTSGSILQGETT